jgi:hypothetical protein
MSLRGKESGMIRRGIRYSCLTRTLNNEKAKRALEGEVQIARGHGI